MLVRIQFVASVPVYQFTMIPKLWIVTKTRPMSISEKKRMTCNIRLSVVFLSSLFCAKVITHFTAYLSTVYTKWYEFPNLSKTTELSISILYRFFPKVACSICNAFLILASLEIYTWRLGYVNVFIQTLASVSPSVVPLLRQIHFVPRRYSSTYLSSYHFQWAIFKFAPIFGW